jgi:hypothetical protein
MIEPITQFPMHWLFELAVICTAFTWGRALVLLVDRRAIGWTVTPLGCVTYLLLGLWLLAICGTVLRFYMPLKSALSLVTFAGISCTALLYVVNRDGSKFSSIIRSKQALIFSSALLILLPLGLGDWGFDAGLYHMTKAMHVAQTENITGLGLLKSYFATNPLTDILRGLGLAIYPSAISMYFINDVMMLILVLYLLQLIFLEERKCYAWLGLTVFFSLWLMGGTENYFDRGIADFTATVATSIAYISLYLVIFESRAPDRNIATENRYFTLGVVAVVFAVLTKLSTTPVAIGYIFYWLFLRTQPDKTWWQSRRLGLFFFLPVTLSIITWLAFHKMVSGCWLYPIASTCDLHTGFHIIVDYDRLLIFLHSRVPGDYLDTTNQAIWWVHWWAKWKTSLILWGIVGGVLLTLVAFLIPIRNKQQIQNSNLAGYVTVLLLLMHSVYWGYTAPDVRYANFLGLLWLGFGIYFVVTRHFSTRLQPILSYLHRNHLVTLLLLPATTLLFLCNFNPIRVITPLPGIPEPTLLQMVTSSGMRFNYAIPDIRCWAAPLPCTLSLDPYWYDRLYYSDEEGFNLLPGDS